MESIAHVGIPSWSISQRIQKKHAALLSNSHIAERGVKESGYVSLGGQGESSRSVFAIARGTTVLETGMATQQALQVFRRHVTGVYLVLGFTKIQVDGDGKRILGNDITQSIHGGL